MEGAGAGGYSIAGFDSRIGYGGFDSRPLLTPKQGAPMQPDRNNPILWFAWYPVVVYPHARFPFRWLVEVWAWRSCFTGKWLYDARFPGDLGSTYQRL